MGIAFDGADEEHVVVPITVGRDDGADSGTVLEGDASLIGARGLDVPTHLNRSHIEDVPLGVDVCEVEVRPFIRIMTLTPPTT